MFSVQMSSSATLDAGRCRSFPPPPGLVPPDVRGRFQTVADAHGVTLGAVVAEAVLRGLPLVEAERLAGGGGSR